MLSPLLLKLPGMAWKAEECFPGGGGDCSSDDAGESFSDKGKVSFWFRLSWAIFEDGGTGRIGIGLMGLLVNLIKERFSTWFSPTCGTAESVTGKVDTGNPPRLWLKCGCGFGSGAVSWWTCSSSIKEPISCHSKFKKWPKKTINCHTQKLKNNLTVCWDLLCTIYKSAVSLLLPYQ